MGRVLTPGARTVIGRIIRAGERVAVIITTREGPIITRRQEMIGAPRRGGRALEATGSRSGER